MVISCHRLLRCNNTIEEDDGTLTSSSFSLQHHHRRKQWHIVVVFFFSNTKKTKHKRKQQKKTKRREGAYLQAPVLPFHFWFSLLPFCFKHFFLASFSSRTKEKKNKEKKNHREENKCEKGREFSLKLPVCIFIFGSRLYLPTSTLLFQTLSLGTFFFSSRRKEKKTKKINP
jgi:preprotein translocase subunit YajC